MQAVEAGQPEERGGVDARRDAESFVDDELVILEYLPADEHQPEEERHGEAEDEVPAVLVADGDVRPVEGERGGHQ